MKRADHAAAAADRLRALHIAGDPLVLVNVWDAESARRVEGAGGRAVATSSVAVAAALGLPDDPTTPREAVFGTVARVAAAVSVPVTADLLDGYGLPPDELVDRLLEAGAVGCNLEDSDHARPGELLDPDLAAERLAAVAAAGRRRGVDLVVNARIDSVLHGGDGDPEATWADVVRRAWLYHAAGASCVYPVRLTDPDRVRDLVAAVGAPVNANIGPGGHPAEVAAAGASRVSVGPQAQNVAMQALADMATDLLSPAGSVGGPGGATDPGDSDRDRV